MTQSTDKILTRGGVRVERKTKYRCENRYGDNRLFEHFISSRREKFFRNLRGGRKIFLRAIELRHKNFSEGNL